jgi:hypothetical protein
MAKIDFMEAVAIAITHGYTKHSSAGAKETWVKQPFEDGTVLFLTLNGMEPDQVTLERYVGIIQCKIGPFSFPHKLFEVWEEQLLNLANPYG